MEKIKANEKITKEGFYGFRKAFIKNKEISLESRFIMILLMTFKGKNETCWPSLGTLAKIANRSSDSIRKYLKELKINGYLKVVSRGIGRSLSYAPSYLKVYAGYVEKIDNPDKRAEIIRQGPDDISRDRSITSGNKEKDLKIGKELFDETRKKYGFLNRKS